LHQAGSQQLEVRKLEAALGSLPAQPMAAQKTGKQARTYLQQHLSQSKEAKGGWRRGAGEVSLGASREQATRGRPAGYSHCEVGRAGLQPSGIQA